MIALTMYSRPGCHLCEEMKAVIDRVASRIALSFEEIDISEDPALQRLYGEEVPVLLVDGRKAAKYRVTELELTRVLMARAADSWKSKKAARSRKPGG